MGVDKKDFSAPKVVIKKNIKNTQASNSREPESRERDTLVQMRVQEISRPDSNPRESESRERRNIRSGTLRSLYDTAAPYILSSESYVASGGSGQPVSSESFDTPFRTTPISTNHIPEHAQRVTFTGIDGREYYIHNDADPQDAYLSGLLSALRSMGIRSTSEHMTLICRMLKSFFESGHISSYVGEINTYNMMIATQEDLSRRGYISIIQLMHAYGMRLDRFVSWIASRPFTSF